MCSCSTGACPTSSMPTTVSRPTSTSTCRVPFPGAAFRQVVDQLIGSNVLMSGSMRLGGRKVRLADAPGNVLNAVAERDTVVPLPATEPASTLVGDPERREELRLPGGHVTF